MNLKNIALTFTLASSTFISTTYASLNPDLNRKEFLGAAKSLVKECVVEYISESTNKVLGYESHCAKLSFKSLDQAYLFLNNEWVLAYLTPSDDADGGDLANLFIVDSKGRLLSYKHNALAFGNILFALASGNSGLTQVKVKN